MFDNMFHVSSPTSCPVLSNFPGLIIGCVSWSPDGSSDQPTPHMRLQAWCQLVSRAIWRLFTLPAVVVRSLLSPLHPRHSLPFYTVLHYLRPTVARSSRCGAPLPRALATPPATLSCFTLPAAVVCSLVSLLRAHPLSTFTLMLRTLTCFDEH